MWTWLLTISTRFLIAPTPPVKGKNKTRQDTADSFKNLLSKSIQTFAQATMETPISISHDIGKAWKNTYQRLFSPPRPLINFSARSSRSEHCCTWVSRSCFFWLASSNSAFNLFKRSSSSWSLAFFSASFSSASLASFYRTQYGVVKNPIVIQKSELHERKKWTVVRGQYSRYFHFHGTLVSVSNLFHRRSWSLSAEFEQNSQCKTFLFI